jgi:small-conductance mechanosensitive channel
MWRKTFIIAVLLGLVSTAATAAPSKEAPAAPAPSAPAATAPAKPAPAAVQAPEKDPPAPVVVEGKTILTIRETVLSATPEERAKEITRRIEGLLKNRALRPDAIKVSEDDMAAIITGEGTTLLRVFDRDAAAEGVTRQALVERHVEAIRAAIEAHNVAFSFRSLLFGAIYAVVATAALLVILLGYRYLFSRLYLRLRELRETRIRSVQIQSFEILHADRIVWLLVTLARWFRILTTALLVYIWMLYVLSLFPWTRGIATAVVGYILDPLRGFAAAVVAFLPDLFFLIVIAFITRYVIKLARFFFHEVERGQVVLPGFYADWAVSTFKIVRFFILAFALTFAFPYIPGSKSEAFKGVSIFLGVLFSLGSTSTISNVMAGLSITYMRAFKVGDRVRIGDTVGDVIDQSLLVTHIRTIKNEDVTVPNAMVLNAHIVNYSAQAKEEGLILHTAITIGYDAPWRTVHELLIEAARKTPCILVTPAPFVLQTALNDFYVTYELNAHTDDPRQMVSTYSTLHRYIQDTFNEAGVEIMSPHYAQLRDGNKTAIPDAYLPKDYVPRSIRVETVPGDRRAPGEGDGEPAGKRTGGGGPAK